MSKITEPHEIWLREILVELIMVLDYRGLNMSDIGKIFRRDRSDIKRLLDENKPKVAKK